MFTSDNQLALSFVQFLRQEKKELDEYQFDQYLDRLHSALTAYGLGHVNLHDINTIQKVRSLLKEVALIIVTICEEDQVSQYYTREEE